MNNVTMVYDENRGTWNVYVGAEWYYEDKSYEKAEAVFNSFFWCDEEDEAYEDWA